MTYNVYYITRTLEEIMASTDDADKAIQMAKREYDRLSASEKKHDKIEIRYDEDEAGNYEILAWEDDEMADLIGKTYEDAEGTWEITDISGEYVDIMLEDSDRYSQVSVYEAIYYIMGGDMDYLWQADAIVDDHHYDEAVNLMDDDLREGIHRTLGDIDDTSFLAIYMANHEYKFDEQFTI